MDLVCRADATPQVGAGHVMRCSRLAEAWQASREGRATIWGEITLPFVARRLEALGIARSPDGPRHGQVLVVDTYDEQERVKRAVHGPAVARVLVDDLGGHVPHGYDVVWNPNAYASAALYPGFPGITWGGAGVIPVRSDLPAWRGAEASITGVMLGGGRLFERAVAVVTRLAEVPASGRFVIIGEWAHQALRSVAAVDPWDTLSRCARLITAAGTSVWEAAAAGIPSVLLVTAPNQVGVAQWAAAAGVPVIDLRGPEEIDALAAQLRSALHRAAPPPRVVDGAPLVAAELAAVARSLAWSKHER